MCISTVLQWEHREHGGQLVPPWVSRAHVGQTDTSGRAATNLWSLVVSHRSLAFALFCSICMSQEEEWLSLGCVARGAVTGRFQSMYIASSPGNGAGLASYIRDRSPGGGG